MKEYELMTEEELTSALSNIDQELIKVDFSLKTYEEAKLRLLYKKNKIECLAKERQLAKITEKSGIDVGKYSVPFNSFTRSEYIKSKLAEGFNYNLSNIESEFKPASGKVKSVLTFKNDPYIKSITINFKENIYENKN